MFTKSQLVVLTLVFASPLLAIPIDTVSLSVESRSAVAKPGHIELRTASVPHLDPLDGAPSEFEARSEVYNAFVVPPATNTDNPTLVSRADGHDPWAGKYANSEKTRQQELKQVAQGHSPTGGNQEDYLRKANGGTLPDKYGQGWEDHMYSKASYNSQAKKAHEYGDPRDAYPNKNGPPPGPNIFKVGNRFSAWDGRGPPPKKGTPDNGKPIVTPGQPVPDKYKWYDGKQH